MLWPFNRFKNSQAPSRGTIEAIYGMIVAQARQPGFYESLNVRDTVNGRLDMVILHMWLVLRRLRSVEGGEQLAQALFDHFCIDMDDNLRELGVSDLKVPKRMQAFGEAFYGRTAAYDMALTEGREAFAQALCKNVLNGENIEKARLLAAYADSVMAAFDRQDDAALVGGAFKFPSPTPAGAEV